VILHGDAMDALIQEEAGVADAEYILCLTNSDSINVLSGVMGKKIGAEQAFSLLNEPSFQNMKEELGIDMVIDPRASTVSSILRHMRRGRIIDLHSIENGKAEVMEGEVLDTSPMAGKTIGDMDISSGIVFGAIIRGGQVLTPDDNLVIKAKDQIVLLAERSSLKDVEKLFRVSMEYF